MEILIILKIYYFLHKYLKSTEKNKKENGEVFTPIKLAKEMFNKLQETNPNLKLVIFHLFFEKNLS